MHEKKVFPEVSVIKNKSIQKIDKIDKKERVEPKVIYPKSINRQKHTKIIKVINNELKNEMSYENTNKIDISLNAYDSDLQNNQLKSTSNLF